MLQAPSTSLEVFPEQRREEKQESSERWNLKTWRCVRFMVKHQTKRSGPHPGQGHCVVFLCKTICSHCASLYPGIWMGTAEQQLPYDKRLGGGMVDEIASPRGDGSRDKLLHGGNFGSTLLEKKQNKRKSLWNDVTTDSLVDFCS